MSSKNIADPNCALLFVRLPMNPFKEEEEEEEEDNIVLYDVKIEIREHELKTKQKATRLKVSGTIVTCC